MRRDHPPRISGRSPDHAAVNAVERHLILRTFSGFRDLAPELIAVIAQYVEERIYPKGSYLFRANEATDRLEFIVSGRVEIRRHGQRLRELGPKSGVGGLAAFANDPYGYDVIALEDCLSLSQRVEDGVDIFEDHFPILRGVLRAISREVLEVRRSLSEGAGFSHTESEEAVVPALPLDLVERMALIRNTMTFARSRVDAVAEMAQESREVRVPAGEVLWREGDPAADMIIIVAGTVDCQTDAGQTFRFGAGDSMGAIDGNAREPRWFTATVGRDLVGLRISMEALYDVFEDNFELAMDLLEGMSRALLAMLDKRAGLTAPTAFLE